MRYAVSANTVSRRLSAAGARFDYRCGPEPGVAELLGDPIVHSLMSADKIDRQSIEAMLSAVRANRDRGFAAVR